VEVLRLAKFLGKNNFMHETGISSKIRKKVCSKPDLEASKNLPKNQEVLKYSHEKQKNVIQFKAN
jgi:hypothetical protein